MFTGSIDSAGTVPLSVASQWPPNETSQQYWDAHCANPAGLFGNLQHFTDALFLRYGRAATNTTARNFLLAGQVASYVVVISSSLLLPVILSEHQPSFSCPCRYETRRAMLEAYCRNKHSSATGLIMWLLNSAHPSHMWNLFDFYGRPSGSVHGPMRATEHYRNDDALQVRSLSLRGGPVCGVLLDYLMQWHVTTAWDAVSWTSNRLFLRTTTGASIF